MRQCLVGLSFLHIKFPDQRFGHQVHSVQETPSVSGWSTEFQYLTAQFTNHGVIVRRIIASDAQDLCNAVLVACKFVQFFFRSIAFLIYRILLALLQTPPQAPRRYVTMKLSAYIYLYR